MAKAEQIRSPKCDVVAVNEEASLCVPQEPPLSVGLAQQVLSCVWPQVLKVDSQSEANTWFDHRLLRYLPLLTSQLISPDVMQNASCLSFKKLWVARFCIVALCVFGSIVIYEVQLTLGLCDCFSSVKTSKFRDSNSKFCSKWHHVSLFLELYWVSTVAAQSKLLSSKDM